jgi:hypothetical protein
MPLPALRQGCSFRTPANDVGGGAVEVLDHRVAQELAGHLEVERRLRSSYHGQDLGARCGAQDLLHHLLQQVRPRWDRGAEKPAPTNAMQSPSRIAWMRVSGTATPAPVAVSVVCIVGARRGWRVRRPASKVP